MSTSSRPEFSPRPELPKVVFLNGASSSGKTTLGRALQARLPEPYLYFSSDQLVEARVLPAVDRTTTEGSWAWANLRPKFFDGFHRCIAALADADNRLIVEHVLEFRTWFEDCVRLLANHDVFFVGVHCPLIELERRERARGDRQLGEGRSHLEDGVHEFGPYDFEVDTSLCSPRENAEAVFRAMLSRPERSAFSRVHEQLRDVT